MEVVLHDNVKHLGRQGQVVKVADGYFRNYLGPQGLAAVATPGNLKSFEKMKKKAMELSAAKEAEARELATQLEGVEITVRAKAGDGEKLFGSVTNQDIVDALAVQGYKVERKQIHTSEAIKHLGEYDVNIDLHAEVQGTVKLKVERA